MKVIFIVQGEGRGHLTQALTLEKALRDCGHEVTEILVGRSRSREVPSFFLHRTQAPVFYGAQNEAYITKILPKPFIFNTFSPIF